MSITRDYWRRSGAGCEIRPRGRSQGCHVAVWAIVDLGEFGSFVSEPLVLGTIGATTSRARGVNPTPRW
jgi:hypothetical protein